MEPETTQMMIGLARMESKIDAIVGHLARLNGSVQRHEEAIQKQASELTVLKTEAGVGGKLAKPAVLILVAVVSAMLGDKTHIGEMLNFFTSK